MTSKVGSFPLLEHVLLLEAELPSSPASPLPTALAQLTPLAHLTTPSDNASRRGHGTQEVGLGAVLQQEPALRALLTSYTSELLHAQQQQRQQCSYITSLYQQLEDDLDGDDELDKGGTRTRGTMEQNSLHPSTRNVPLPEVGTPLVSASSETPNPWPLLPVAKEGLYIQVPSAGYIRACRQWASEAAHPAASTEVYGNSTYNEQPPRNPATLLYADTQRYFAEALAADMEATAPAAASQGTSTAGGGTPSLRRRNDEGFIYGYALYLGGNLLFHSPTAIHNGHLTTADNNKERGLVLCLTSTSPSFNFMRALVLQVAHQICHAVKAAGADAARDAAQGTSAYRSLLLANLLKALEPLRELTNPCSVYSTTPPGRPLSLRLAFGGKPQAAPRGQGTAGDGAPATFTANRPCDLLYPFLDTPMAMLLLSFPYDAVRVLHALLLRESRVVVIGATPQHAAACVLAATSLVTPMVWSAPLIPYVTPSHVSESGLLDTLLAPSAEMEARRRAARRLRRPTPQTAVPLLESGGYLLGSTAALVPQLMLRLSAIAATTGRNGEVRALGEVMAGTDSRQASALEKERLWIADARTGSVGVVPLEPLSLLFSRAAVDLSQEEGRRSSSSTTTTTAMARPMVTFPCQTEFQRRVLKHATSRNAAIIASFALLDIPPAHDKLKSAIKKAVSADQRLAFRVALETMAALTQDRQSTRAEEREQLESLLRQVRLHLDTTTVDEREGTSFGGVDGGGGGGTATDVSFTMSDSASDSEESGYGGGGSLSGVPPRQHHYHHQPSLQTLNSSFASPNALGNSSFAFPRPGAPVVAASARRGGPPAFPVVSSVALVEVHAALLELNAQRLFGNYRKGLMYIQSRPAGINVASFLPSNLNNNFKLAEAISNTHMYKQFEKALLCMESLGLNKVLRGEFVSACLSAPPTPHQQHHAMSMNYYVAHPRMVALMNVFMERSRRKFGELFPDSGGVNGTSVSATVYSSMMAVANDAVALGHRVALAATTPTPIVAHGTSSDANAVVSPSQHYRVPALAFIAGYEATPLTSDAAAPGYANHNDPRSMTGLPPPVPSGAGSSGSGGGGGGGVKRFFAKAARAVKHNFSGSGANSSSTSHVATVPIPVYVQAVCSFADFSETSGGGTLTAADAQRIVQLSQHSHKHARKRLHTLAARSRVGKSRGGRGPRWGKASSTGTSPASNSPALGALSSGSDAGGNAALRRHRRHHHHPTRSSDVSVDADEDVGQLQEEEAARLYAFHQQTALAVEFSMPEGLSANDQATVASAAAAAAGEDGVALSGTVAVGSGGGAVGGGSGGAAAAGGQGGYASGVGVETEYMRQIAMGSAGDGTLGQARAAAATDFPTFTGSLGPILCRPLPLDAIHQFAEYHPLLQTTTTKRDEDGERNGVPDPETLWAEKVFCTPVSRTPGGTTSYTSATIDVAFSSEATLHHNNNASGDGASQLTSAAAAAAAEKRLLEAAAKATITPTQAELYATLTTLCPSNVAAWVSAERLAEIALLQPRPQKPPHPKPPGSAQASGMPPSQQPQQLQEDRSPNFSPANAAPTVSIYPERTTLRPPPPSAPRPQVLPQQTQPEPREAPRRRALFDELFDDSALPPPPPPSASAAATGASAQPSSQRPVGAAPQPSFADWGNFSSGAPEGFSSGAPTSDTFAVPAAGPSVSLTPSLPPTATTATMAASPTPALPGTSRGTHAALPQRSQVPEAHVRPARRLDDDAAWENWGAQAPPAVAGFAATPAASTSSMQPQSSLQAVTSAPAPGNVMDELFSTNPSPAAATEGGGGAPKAGAPRTFDDYFR